MGPSPGDLKDGGPQSVSPASFTPRVPFSLEDFLTVTVTLEKTSFPRPCCSVALCGGFAVFVTSY